MTAVEELREALKDPRMTMEFFVIGQALVEVAENVDKLLARADERP